MKVLVVNRHEKPLMPTTPRTARRLLTSGKAVIWGRDPFTIKLVHGASGYVQPATLGIDAGYQQIGFSAVSQREELLGGEIKMLAGMSERIAKRAQCRRKRRNRLRHRPARFLNRTKQSGWLAPSIRHKLDTHLKLIERLTKRIPVREIVVEVASFDVQKLKDPGVSRTGYQQGEQTGFGNLREYILHRDRHTCQNPACRNRTAKPVLQVHHVGYWQSDHSDRPGNLVTLCDWCHTPANHEPGQQLWGWQPKVKSFRPETFMTLVWWKLVRWLNCAWTFGYLTKAARIELGLPKSHHHDAFVIAGGTTQARCTPLMLEQLRRNKRSLEQFYDAQYLDLRNGKKASGQSLNSGRRIRNTNLGGENLRRYRGHKVSPGRRSIKRHRYHFAPGDRILFEGKVYVVVGMQNLGKYLRLKGYPKGVKPQQVTHRRRAGGCQTK